MSESYKDEIDRYNEDMICGMTHEEAGDRLSYLLDLLESQVSKARSLALDGLAVDGKHHKQYALIAIAKALEIDQEKISEVTDYQGPE